MLPYRAGQFFVGANVWSYPGPKGDRQNGIGSGQVKAYNAITGEFAWEKMEKFSVWGGTMATKGGLVFYGTLDGFIKAVMPIPVTCCGNSNCHQVLSVIL